MTRAGRQRGFTLIELLVVLAVLSVVSTIGVSAFVSITSYYNATERRLDLEEQAQRAFDYFADDVALMVPSSFANASVLSTREMEEEARYGRVPLENDSIVLPISYYDPLQKQVVRASVQYIIDRSMPLPQLQRRQAPGFGVVDPDGRTMPIADGVLSMRIEYFDGRKWQPAWTEEQHPRSIRLSVTVRDPYRPDEQLSRRSAFPVRVR